jgi:6-phosphogluconolactonase
MTEPSPESSAAPVPEAAVTAKSVVYVGSDDGNIHVFDVDLPSGALTAVQSVPAGPSPSFLAINPAGSFLFAVNEIGDWNGTGTGAIASFTIDPTAGTLVFVDRKSSGGAGPAHVATDRSGGWVVASNYGGGTVATLRVNPDGSLVSPGSIQSHGEGAHPHLSMAQADNKFIFVPDLNQDQVRQYRFDVETGVLHPNDPPWLETPKGEGPRHMDFHPTADLAFVVNESSDTVTSYRHDAATGRLSVLSTARTLPDGTDGKDNNCADIHVSPHGKHLYVSNRGHESIAVFSIDIATGKLSPLQHEPTGGNHPRNFEIDPAGTLLLVANRHSNNVVAFTIDPATGRVRPTGQVTTVPGPSFVGIHSLAVGSTP